jgi:hypothetical protein
MSDREKTQELNRKLQVLEQRPVTNWERPILEVARRFARWNQMIPSPVFVKSER